MSDPTGEPQMRPMIVAALVTALTTLAAVPALAHVNMG